nr:hypothetical protein GCM10020092_028560 [Actinoplanes digitatis]
MRTDLTRILHDATAADVEYVFGDAVAAMAEDADGVEVTFASGTVRRFALVVGADGLHSATRRMAIGEVPLRHLGAHISIFDVPDDLGLDREEVFYTEPGRMVFAYSTGSGAPTKVGLVFGSESPVLDRSVIEERFAGMGWQVPRFLEVLRGTRDVYFDSLSQIELPRWSARPGRPARRRGVLPLAGRGTGHQHGAGRRLCAGRASWRRPRASTGPRSAPTRRRCGRTWNAISPSAARWSATWSPAVGCRWPCATTACGR